MAAGLGNIEKRANNLAQIDLSRTSKTPRGRHLEAALAVKHFVALHCRRALVGLKMQCRPGGMPWLRA
jgi:hypothetical protein